MFTLTDGHCGGGGGDVIISSSDYYYYYWTDSVFRDTGSYLICSDPCKIAISKRNYAIDDEIISLSHIISLFLRPRSPKCDRHSQCVRFLRLLRARTQCGIAQNECVAFDNLRSSWSDARAHTHIKIAKCNSVWSPEGLPLVCRAVSCVVCTKEATVDLDTACYEFLALMKLFSIINVTRWPCNLSRISNDSHLAAAAAVCSAHDGREIKWRNSQPKERTEIWWPIDLVP